MIAIKRLQSIMWILVVAMGALAAYLISLRVATERNAVHHLIDQIRWTRSEIRYLEAEFGARASLRQLTAWNQNDLRLYVPGPGQYLPDERALANLEGMAPVGDGYAPPPVMVAMAKQDEAAPVELAAAAPRKPSTEVRAPSEFALIRTASAAEPVPGRVNLADTRPLPKRTDKAAVRPDPAARKTARLALLDEKLLGGTAFASGEGKVR
ncbi:hypothetical protein SLG_05860 [Sphingobium sp. SYK-6]|uniref:hypothetical protein n=1 Tax=Sphingobium sp. (strain NBRC 103272 / SYK-6) TaxID=627192 RepID=UPI00022767E5|nr:hypothetical protein [Sphingobium sp. SYK-6]BAK65261.1 hypothetical protein SLG_05860 [Sphingobium sp. SYK-6]